jgi:hypothetical protein
MTSRGKTCNPTSSALRHRLGNAPIYPGKVDYGFTPGDAKQIAGKQIAGTRQAAGL